MKFDELIVLLPCHSLEDFPTHHQGEEAEGLLAAWSALWHPLLLATVGKAPTWSRASYPPDDLHGKLIVVPTVAEKELPGGFSERAESLRARLVRKLCRRSDIVAALLTELNEAAASPVGAESVASMSPAGLDPELVADFLALGTCYLQTELLTRRMRYVSNLDETQFHANLLAAAAAAVGGDPVRAKESLTLCFNALLEARGRYYPVDASLIDLTLVASTTVGPSLRKELAGVHPLNLMLSGRVLAEMAQREPATLAAVRQALDRGETSLVGGEWDEAELPLLPLESILAQFELGLAEYLKHLGRRPEVFGRRRHGLTPALPQILSGLGFRGVIHSTLDDGRFPQGENSKVRWEGPDASAIDALGRVPFDAGQAGNFAALADKIGHSMDHDQVATIILAHWPSQFSLFYEDLRRMASYAPVLGRFITLDRFFADTASAGQFSKFAIDAYRTPYLQQAVDRGQIDPISRYVRFYSCRTKADAAQSLGTLIALLGRPTGPVRPLLETLERSGTSVEPPQAAAIETQAEGRLRESLTDFAAVLPRSKLPRTCGYLAVNPYSFTRRMLVDVSELPALPSVEAPVKAAAETAGKKQVLVELPPMGFAWIQSPAGEPGRPWSGDPIAEDQMLRNEFCEVSIHPDSGGIRSIHDYTTRGNRLSQQLAFRLPPSRPEPGDAPGAGDENSYSRMVAELIEVTESGSMFGEIVSRGQLLDPKGKRLAGFVQRVQMTLGSRVVVVEIELDPAVEPQADPWNSYFASRFAWSDTGAELRRSLHLQGHPTTAKRLEAPYFVELNDYGRRTSLLTGGLPWHCRIGRRMLDSLLIVKGETARRFRIGVGIDVPHPSTAALDLMAPPSVHRETSSEPAPNNYGWLMHVDAKNVVATHWEPIWAPEGAPPSSVDGFRVRLLETEGRAGRVQLRSFRAARSARRTNLTGQSTGNLVIEQDRIQLDIGAYAWIQIEARWNDDGDPR